MPSNPIIVLVRPQLGENIGKAARAMLNFGLTEMRLVSPRDGWPNPQAGPAASGADVVLERAAVFDSVADAVADCGHVYATTVRKRGVTKPVVTPEAAATRYPRRVRALGDPVRAGALGPGNRRCRARPHDHDRADQPEFGSLNLAQAVILVAYEWSKGAGLASPPAVELDPPAPHEELEGMIGQLDAMLETTGYYFPPDRTHVTKRTLRTMLTKPGWTSAGAAHDARRAVGARRQEAPANLTYAARPPRRPPSQMAPHPGEAVALSILQTVQTER